MKKRSIGVTVFGIIFIAFGILGLASNIVEYTRPKFHQIQMQESFDKMNGLLFRDMEKKLKIKDYPPAVHSRYTDLKNEFGIIRASSESFFWEPSLIFISALISLATIVLGVLTLRLHPLAPRLVFHLILISFLYQCIVFVYVFISMQPLLNFLVKSESFLLLIVGPEEAMMGMVSKMMFFITMVNNGLMILYWALLAWFFTRPKVVDQFSG